MFARIPTSAVLAGVTALSLMAPAALATTVSLTYQGASAGADAKSVTIIAVPVAYPGAGDWPRSVGAYGFNMLDGSGVLGSFVAWCLDLGSFLAKAGDGGQDYTITSDPFSNSYGLSPAERARIQTVFDANYASVDLANGNQVAGFQLALWEMLYDGDGSLGTGSFMATASAAITGLANGYLAAAAGWDGGKLYAMTFLESAGATKRQNLVTVTPAAVPVPAAGGMLLLALGGLAAMRRARKVRR